MGVHKLKQDSASSAYKKLTFCSSFWKTDVCYELYCWLVECGGFECLLVDVWRCGGWTAPWVRLLQCGLCDTCGSAFSGCDPALVAFNSVLWILTKILCNILLGTSSMVKLLWELRIFLDIHVWLSIEWLTFYR